LFLDEPTTGFDPAARRNAWAMIENLKSLGKTIFLTTHYMDEAQNLADRVAIIVDGRIVAEGPPGELAGHEPAATEITFVAPAGAGRLPDRLRSMATEQNGRTRLSTQEPVAVLHELTEWALRQGSDLEGLTVRKPSLEDVYLELTAPPSETAAP
jgi:ABC-2 type transport system ATP-binding protein